MYQKTQLFAQLSDTIEKNVRDLVEKFKDNGLTLDDYLKACIKQQSLFTQLPDTIEKNVKNLVDKFKDNGLTLDRYLEICIKNQTLFYRSPDTISEHIDILKFSRMNTEDDITENNFFEKILPRFVDLSNSSSLLLIKYLIIPKMFEGEKIPKELKRNKLREKLNDYLKTHPEKHFTLNIKPIKTDTDCLKILDETLSKIEEDANRENIFKINIQ